MNNSAFIHRNGRESHMRSIMGWLFATLLVVGLAYDSSALIFSLDHNDLPASGQIVETWGDFTRGGGAPTSRIVNGQRWYFNEVVFEEEGLPNQFPMMRHNDSPFADPIPINGATIVVAVKPVRYSFGGDPWNSIVDIFYDQLCIGISNISGQVKVKIDDGRGTNPVWTAPEETAIADGEAGVLSMVVTNTGAFTVYWKGEDGFEREIGSGQGNVLDLYNQLVPGADGRGHARAINIGRNDPDGWPIFNGYIGDTYVYGYTLDEWDRVDLVDATFAAMGLAIDEPPAAPMEIIYPATSSSGQYEVSWTLVEAATLYRLERSIDNGASWAEVYADAENRYMETVTSGSYRYRVRAENPLGISDWVTGDHEVVVDVVFPGALTALQYIVDPVTGQFTINWEEMAGAAIYRLERSADGGDTWTQIYAGAGTSYTEAADFGVFLYQVRAENQLGESDWFVGSLGVWGSSPPRPAGFVRMELAANQWMLAGISFDQPDASAVSLADVLGTTGFANATRAMVWDTATLQYKTADFFAGAWFGEALSLARGQGFWIRSPVELDLFLVGQVPQPEETTLPLLEGLQLFSSPYPVAVDLNDADVFTSEPIDGDRLTKFDGVSYSTADFFLGQWFGDAVLQPGLGFWYRSGGEQDMTVVKPYE
jgi:hypothetical protein